MENLPNEVLLCIYKYADYMDLISLEQVSRRFYETIRSMVWPRVCRIGWSYEHLVRKIGPFMEYQKVGDPKKLIPILKRVGSHVPVFEFNYVKDTQQYLLIAEEQRGGQITEYEYSLPFMFSLLNSSCVVELVLCGTPIRSEELILIADTFTQLRTVDFSYGSLSCAAEERQNMTESFSNFLEKLSSYGRLEELCIRFTFDSTHLHFEHIPQSLKSLDLMHCKLNSRDLRHIGRRCHQLEYLMISVHHDVTREDLTVLLGGMQSEFKQLLAAPFLKCRLLNFRRLCETVWGQSKILRNMELFDFPKLLCVTLRSDIITDESLKVLAKCPKLWNLELNCDEITDQGLIPIICQGTLGVLSVSGRQITDKVARLAIERCKRLRWLTIGEKYTILNSEEILEMVNCVMDERYGPNERPTGRLDSGLFHFNVNKDTFQCKNLHPWVFVNHE